MAFGPMDNAKLWVWVGISAAVLVILWIAWAAG
jgi:hypothetical protein